MDKLERVKGLLLGLVFVVVILGAALWIYNSFIADKHSVMGEPNHEAVQEENNNKYTPEKDEPNPDYVADLGDPVVDQPEDCFVVENNVLGSTVELTDGNITITSGVENISGYSDFGLPLNIAIKSSQEGEQFIVSIIPSNGTLYVPSNFDHYYNFSSDETAFFISNDALVVYPLSYTDGENSIGWKADYENESGDTLKLIVSSIETGELYGLYNLDIQNNEGVYSIRSISKYESDEAAAKVGDDQIQSVVSNTKYGIFIGEINFITFDKTERLYSDYITGADGYSSLGRTDISNSDVPLFVAFVSFKDSGYACLYFNNDGVFIGYNTTIPLSYYDVDSDELATEDGDVNTELDITDDTNAADYVDTVE